MALEALVARAEALYHDLSLEAVTSWKQRHPGALAIGSMPVYVPREILHAASVLPVGVMGGGDQVEIIRGDAYFQSYICQIPRSTIELALTGRLDALDGMLFPSICDVIRNLSGMWRLLFPDKFIRYVDLPQNFDPDVGGRFYKQDLQRLAEDLGNASGTPVTEDRLRRSIALYNENRDALAELDALRIECPWKVPADEAYLMGRAGNLLPVDEHTALVRDYLQEARERSGAPRDDCRVVLTGAFCEQPPLALIRTLQGAGCSIVDDDLVLGARFIQGEVNTEGDPFDALVEAFLTRGVDTASRYDPGPVRGEGLVRRVEESGAEGVIFCAPSFCDPALLEQPMLIEALDRHGIPHTSFKYSENLGQFQVIREQTGTFADSLRLWGEA